VVLGKHSGSQGVRQAYDALGLPVSERFVALLLTRIRIHSTQFKQPPSASDLYRFLMEVRDTVGEMS
jgi:homocitrate synthase NifV